MSNVNEYAHASRGYTRCINEASGEEYSLKESIAICKVKWCNTHGQYYTNDGDLMNCLPKDYPVSEEEAAMYPSVYIDKINTIPTDEEIIRAYNLRVD